MKDNSTRAASRLHKLAHPRPATIIIALFALVTATGGTSLADSVINGSALKNASVSRSKIAPNSIDSTRLAANSVTTPKLANKAVDSTKLAKAAVTAASIKPGSVTAPALRIGSVTAAAIKPGSVTGPALAAGAVAAANLAPATVSWKVLGAQVVAAPPVTLPGATATSFVAATATATCPNGTVAISGGESISDVTKAFVIQSLQAGAPGAPPTGWVATGASGDVAPQTMTVYAICINAGT
jgi:hypothetical protein